METVADYVADSIHTADSTKLDDFCRAGALKLHDLQNARCDKDQLSLTNRAMRCISANRKRNDSANAKYSASHGNQTISSTRPSCWIQISTVYVINIAADYQKFTTLTGEL